MTELGSEAHALLTAGRGAFKPTGADRMRVLQALQVRLGDGVGAADHGGSPATTSAGGGAWGTLPAAVAGLGIVGALVFSLPPRAHLSGAQVVPQPVVAVAPAPPRQPMVESERPPAVVPPLVAPDERAAPSRRPTDRLAEEVAILSRAETDLHAGRLTTALRVLDEHQRKFPNGALSQERRAARVHVLCAMGRTSEAEAELARLTRLSPTSPHAGRARDACAATPKK